MSITELTTFLGWCTLINFILLTITFIFLSVFRTPILSLHSKLFGITRERLGPLYLQIMAQYKVLIIMFNLVPYLVLRLGLQ